MEGSDMLFGGGSSCIVAMWVVWEVWINTSYCARGENTPKFSVVSLRLLCDNRES